MGRACRGHQAEFRDLSHCPGCHMCQEGVLWGQGDCNESGAKANHHHPNQGTFWQCSNVGEYVSLGKHNTDRIVECVSWKVDQVPMVVESWVSVLPRNLL